MCGKGGYTINIMNTSTFVMYYNIVNAAQVMELIGQLIFLYNNIIQLSRFSSDS